jgi:hypothetical protein
MGILTGTQYPARLIKHEIELLLRKNLLPIHLDNIVARGNRDPLLRNDHSIDRNPAVCDELLAGTPGSYATGGEIFLEPNLITQAWFWGALVHGYPLSTSRACAGGQLVRNV